MLSFLFSFFTENLIYPLIIPGFLAGVIAILVSLFLPNILAGYKIPVLLGGCVCVLFFTFYGGKYSMQNQYELENAKIKAENAELHTKSVESTANATIQYVEKIKYVDRWKEVKTNVYVTKTDDEKCVIDPGTRKSIRMLYNDSIEGRLPESP